METRKLAYICLCFLVLPRSSVSILKCGLFFFAHVNSLSFQVAVSLQDLYITLILPFLSSKSRGKDILGVQLIPTGFIYSFTEEEVIKIDILKSFCANIEPLITGNRSHKSLRVWRDKVYF